MRTYRKNLPDHDNVNLMVNGWSIRGGAARDMMRQAHEYGGSWARPPREGARPVGRQTVICSAEFVDDLPEEIAATDWADLALAVRWPYRPEALAVLYTEGPSWVREPAAGVNIVTDAPPQRQLVGTHRGAPVYVTDEAKSYTPEQLDALMEHAVPIDLSFSNSVPNAGVGTAPTIAAMEEASKAVTAIAGPPAWCQRCTAVHTTSICPRATTMILGGKFLAMSELAQRALVKKTVEAIPPVDEERFWQRFVETSKRLVEMALLDDLQRLAVECGPSAVASAPAIDRSGPRVYCQSQYDPDD